MQLLPIKFNRQLEGRIDVDCGAAQTLRITNISLVILRMVIQQAQGGDFVL